MPDTPTIGASAKLKRQQQPQKQQHCLNNNSSHPLSNGINASVNTNSSTTYTSTATNTMSEEIAAIASPATGVASFYRLVLRLWMPWIFILPYQFLCLFLVSLPSTYSFLSLPLISQALPLWLVVLLFFLFLSLSFPFSRPVCLCLSVSFQFSFLSLNALTSNWWLYGMHRALIPFSPFHLHLQKYENWEF